MKIRPRSLPPGWYPDDAGSVAREVEGYDLKPSGGAGSGAVSGVAPHAGWAFSGAVAAEVFARLDPSAETVVVAGGHLSSADRSVAATEEAYEVPGGVVRADVELLGRIRTAADLAEDRRPDNTVEVQLPLVAHFFSSARALWLRAAPTVKAYELGKALQGAAAELGRRVAVVGSTDLTHYGPNYGFSPAGSGSEAVRWVREVNDARMVEALVEMDPEAVVARAAAERSACSAGGALVAMGFAAAQGIRQGLLVRYRTSYDVHPDRSFVGYAGIVYAA